MSLFQVACETYDHLDDRVGVLRVDEKEPLTPVSHLIQKAQIEITLLQDGSFESAREVQKGEEATVIPVTIESASRTSKFVPHPLCEQLVHIWNTQDPNCQAYLEQLREWVESDYSHEKARAVLRYVESGSIAFDLIESGILSVGNDSKLIAKALEKTPDGKKLIRWLVVPSTEPACWKDRTLFDSFIRFYDHCLNDHEKRFCQISGNTTVCTDAHPKGTVKMSFGAKLISANDSSGFTYRGRFTNKEQAGSVGYLASQKAHNALRWLIANHGIVVDGRAFLCWNPQGRRIPDSGSILDSFVQLPEKEIFCEENYRNRLRETILGYRCGLPPESKVVVVVFDAATTGRLSVVYYSEQMAGAFFDNIERWFDTCCWSCYRSTIFPSVLRIAKAAFGTERNDGLEVDDRLKKSTMQRLLGCITQGQRIPLDIVRALGLNASNPQRYKNARNREIVLSTACAVVRKSRKESKGEEWKMSLDEDVMDRSYLFGRLLAIAEKVEKDTYDSKEQRETNAIRLQSVFSQRPLYAWRIMEERLLPYYARLNPGHRAYYKNLIGEIWEKITVDEAELRKPLEDTYLIGYYNQRSDFYKKKKSDDNADESSESEE